MDSVAVTRRTDVDEAEAMNTNRSDKLDRGAADLLALMRREPGRVVSGASLSRELGVSRTAVWKRVNRLRALGYGIESTQSAGYRFVGAPDTPLAEEVQLDLATDLIGRDVCYRPSIDSTNALAVEMARKGAAEGTVVVADRQILGRGRLGRSWVSPAGCNLYVSILLRPPMAPAAIPQITLMTAVSLQAVLSQSAALPVRIKWPNDLWVGKRKIGGILTEMASEMDQIRYVVVGFGVNVNLTADALPEQLQHTATSLSLETGRTWPRVPLLRSILRALDEDYASFCREGFAPFRSRFIQESMTLGRRIRVRTPEGETAGRALDITEQGALRIRRDDGSTLDILSGEVTVLPESPAGEQRRAGIRLNADRLCVEVQACFWLSILETPTRCWGFSRGPN